MWIDCSLIKRKKEIFDPTLLNFNLSTVLFNWVPVSSKINYGSVNYGLLTVHLKIFFLDSIGRYNVLIIFPIILIAALQF